MVATRQPPIPTRFQIWDTNILLYHQRFIQFDQPSLDPWGQRYCWWLKFCTSWYVVYPNVYRVLCIPGGAGFSPSIVSSAITSLPNKVIKYSSFITFCTVTKTCGLWHESCHPPRWLSRVQVPKKAQNMDMFFFSNGPCNAKKTAFISGVHFIPCDLEEFPSCKWRP